MKFSDSQIVSIRIPQGKFLPHGIWVLANVLFNGSTYLFNIFALTQLRASTLSAFVYVQPLLGILFAVAMGKDSLTTVKILAASLVLLGVYLASKKPKPGAQVS